MMAHYDTQRSDKRRSYRGFGRVALEDADDHIHCLPTVRCLDGHGCHVPAGMSRRRGAAILHAKFGPLT